MHWAGRKPPNPSDMVNLGWNITSFKPGDKSHWSQWSLLKNGLPIGRIDQVQLANGQILKGRVVF